MAGMLKEFSKIGYFCQSKNADITQLAKRKRFILFSFLLCLRKKGKSGSNRLFLSCSGCVLCSSCRMSFPPRSLCFPQYITESNVPAVLRTMCGFQWNFFPVQSHNAVIAHLSWFMFCLFCLFASVIVNFFFTFLTRCQSDQFQKLFQFNETLLPLILYDTHHLLK